MRRGSLRAASRGTLRDALFGPTRGPGDALYDARHNVFVRPSALPAASEVGDFSLALLIPRNVQMLSRPACGGSVELTFLARDAPADTDQRDADIQLSHAS